VRFHPWFSPRIRVVSRVLDQELMCAPKEKMQDPIRNAKWNGNAEFPCRVLSRCCLILRTCGNKSLSPWWNMRTVWAILPMKMSILLEHSIKHGAVSMAEQHSWLSNLHVKASVLLVKHWSSKISLLRCCSLHFALWLVEFPVKNHRLSFLEMASNKTQFSWHCRCNATQKEGCSWPAQMKLFFFAQKWWFMIPAERLSFSSPAFHLDQHCLADEESCCLLLHHGVLTDLAKIWFCLNPWSHNVFLLLVVSF